MNDEAKTIPKPTRYRVCKPRNVTLPDETWDRLLDVARSIGSNSRSYAITHLARNARLRRESNV